MRFFDLMKKAALDVEMEFTEAQYEQFIKYMRLLQEWNEKINLTAITEDEEVVKKHFIDCIKAFKSDAIKNANTVIDVGTGAGFPGLPIAIMNPEVKVTLLDSLNKRINFLNLVVRELGLKNVTTIHSRAEDYAKYNKESFDIVTSRAVANLNTLSELCIPMVKIGGYFISMKADANLEVENAKNAIKTLGGVLRDTIVFNLLYDAGVRTLIKIEKVSKTNIKYPRKISEIKKKPM